MGVSTNAILVWGFDLGTDLPDSVIERLDDFEKYDALVVIQNRIGASLISHCHPDEQMWIVGFTKTIMLARRGYPETIKSFTVDAVRGQAALDALAHELGIKPKPGRWLLASEWS